MKVRRISMSTRIFVLVSILLLLSDVLIGAVFYYRTKGLLTDQVLNNILSLTQTSAGNVDGAVLHTLEFGDSSSDNYKLILEQLKKIRDISNVEYVYAVRPDGTQLKYMIDADEDVNAGDVFKPIGEFEQQAVNGKACVDPNPYTDEFGTHFTAYCPVYDGTETAGIICMDSSYSLISEPVNGTLVMVIIICSISFVIGVLLLLFIRTRLAKGFRTLNSKVEELAGGGGDLTKRIEIQTGD